MKPCLASLAFCLLALSCQKHEPKKPKQINSSVVEKAELYKRLHAGWAHQGGCDSLGFTALAKLAGGSGEADILQAEGEPGRWYRNPSKTCYDTGASKSDISKDMFIMLLPYLYASKDQQNIQEIYDYGQKNGWVMGRGYLSRTFLTPSVIFLIEQMLGVWRTESLSKDIQKAGFEKHLDAIYLINKWMVNGTIDSLQYEQIRRYREENPKNALMQAIYHKFGDDGDQSETIAILLDETLFPNDRLPTSKDRCEEYLWQRDPGYDWLPCDSDKIHDGVDYLIAAWVAGQLDERL
jgi:hypothetical protein